MTDAQFRPIAADAAHEAIRAFYSKEHPLSTVQGIILRALRKVSEPAPAQVGRTDAERLNFFDKHSVIRITTTTEAGKSIKHIEVDGTAIRVRGEGIRAALDALKEPKPRSTSTRR